MSSEQLRAALLERAKRERARRQQPQEEVGAAEDFFKSLGSGAVRGAIGLAETPEMLYRAGKAGYQLATGAEEITPIFDTRTGRALREATTLDDYEAQTRAGRYAGTVGEFLPAAITGPAGVAKALVKKEALKESVKRAGSLAGQATAAGLGSEAAGELAEGTALEPYARIAGAVIAPYQANKTLSAFQKKNVKSPTIASLKAEKTAAYDALKKEGVGFTADQTSNLLSEMRSVLNLDDIILSAKPSIERALKIMDEVEEAGAMNLAKFNELQKSLGKIYRSAPDAPEVLSMMSKMDNVLADGSKDKSLLLAAKAANKKYSKARMLDKYFTKAVEGAGRGRIVANTGEALQSTATRILRNDKNLDFWSSDEITALKALSQGSVPTRIMGAIGKLSPTSGGLMTGLNLAVAFASPYNMLEIIGMTATTFSKLGYNAKVKASRKALEDLVKAGGVKEPSKVITKELAEDLAARLGGLLATESQEQ